VSAPHHSLFSAPSIFFSLPISIGRQHCRFFTLTLLPTPFPRSPRVVLLDGASPSSLTRGSYHARFVVFYFPIWAIRSPIRRGWPSRISQKFRFRECRNLTRNRESRVSEIVLFFRSER
jgi:hypothetical protein